MTVCHRLRPTTVTMTMAVVVRATGRPANTRAGRGCRRGARSDLGTGAASPQAPPSSSWLLLPLMYCFLAAVWLWELQWRWGGGEEGEEGKRGWSGRGSENGEGGGGGGVINNLYGRAGRERFSGTAHPHTHNVAAIEIVRVPLCNPPIDPRWLAGWPACNSPQPKRRLQEQSEARLGCVAWRCVGVWEHRRRYSKQEMHIIIAPHWSSSMVG